MFDCFCFNSQSRCMNFNFPPKAGTGFAALFKSVSPTCLDLLCKLCTYDPDERCVLNGIGIIIIIGYAGSLVRMC